jgi:hypothetical protein
LALGTEAMSTAALHTRHNSNRGQLRGSCKAVGNLPHYTASPILYNKRGAGASSYSTSTIRIRTTGEGPQREDPQGGSSERAKRGNGRRPGRRPSQNAGSSRGGGRYIKRGAAQKAALTERGRPSHAGVAGSGRHPGPRGLAAVELYCTMYG